MRWHWRKTVGGGGLALLAATSLAATLAGQGMQGDTAAVAMARRIVDNMGGAQLWAQANWVYTREHARFAVRDSALDVQFWRRTDSPAEWASITSHQFRRAWAWTAAGGWEARNGDVRGYDRAEMQSRLGWWAGEIYVMYVRFARDDPGLRLETTGPRSFVVLDDEDGEHLGEFHVNTRGELVRWERRFGMDHEDYIYGPLKQVGPIRVPDWGANSDGSFMFYYTDFRLSRTPPGVSFDPPDPAGER